MRRQSLEERIGGSRVEPAAVAHPVVLASSAFVLGVVTGLFLKGSATQMYERMRNRLWHRDYERTVAYDENLPDSLERREPAPHSGQPRYGGTGAIGVPSTAVVTAQPGKHKRRN
jgi:hypothetical protein